MNEKKLYWLIEDNADLSAVCETPEQCLILLENDFDSLNEDEKPDVQYTITPEYYTEQEFNNLKEQE